MKATTKVNAIDNSRQQKLFTRFIDAVIFVYILSIYILSVDSVLNAFSRLLALGTMALLALYAFMKGSFKLGGITLVFGAFTVFCLFSCIWAVGLDPAVSKTMTIAQIFLLIALLHNYLSLEKKYAAFFNMLLWSGTIFAGYVVLRLGVNVFLEGLEEGLRMGGEINNLNAIALMTTLTIIMSLWQVFYQKKLFYWLNAGLSALVSLAAGSRTALIALLFGLLLLFFLKGNYGKKLISLFQGALIITALFLILRLPAFEAFTERIEALFDALFEGDTNDTSVSKRLEMIIVGFQEFLKSPIIGHGIGYSAVITPDIFGWETYLHNNYIELLSSVGLIGTGIYYALFFSPLKKLFSYVKKQHADAVFIATVLLTLLVTHIGTVDYYDKLIYLYLLLAWLAVEKIVNEKENTENVAEAVENNQES